MLDFDLIDSLNYHGSWRPGQREAIIEILEKLETNPRTFELMAPTGIGKTLILFVIGSYCIQKFGFKKVIYTVPQVSLIEQLKGLPGVGVLIGRKNYPCLASPGQSAEVCVYKDWSSAKSDRPVCKKCPYRMAKRKLDSCQFKAVTLDLYLSDYDLGKDCELHLMDESASLEELLINRGSYVMPPNLDVSTKDSLLQTTKRELDLKHEEVEEITIELRLKYNTYLFARTSIKDALYKERVAFLEEQIRKLKEYRSELRTECTKLFTIYVHLTNNREYYVETTENKKKFIPLFGKDIYEKVFPPALNRIFTSATPATQLLDIPFETVCIGHIIPVERRQVYVDPVASVSQKHDKKEALTKIAKKCEELHNRTHKKTLIHCKTYQNAMMIYEALSPEAQAVSILQEGGKRNDSREEFIKTPGECIFLSIKFDEGLDLKDPEYNLNIIIKVPYPYLGIVQRMVMAADDGLRYNLETAIKIQQASGRCTRSAEDYSETYILDTAFVRYYRSHKDLLLPWFKEALVWL